MAKELEVLETNRKKLKAKHKLMENDIGNTVNQNSAQTTLPAFINQKRMEFRCTRSETETAFA